MKEWSSDSQSLQRLAHGLAFGALAARQGAMQREEVTAEVSAENQVSEESVVAALQGIRGCGKGGREGRRNVFNARMWAEVTHTESYTLVYTRIVCCAAAVVVCTVVVGTVADCSSSSSSSSIGRF